METMTVRRVVQLHGMNRMTKADVLKHIEDSPEVEYVPVKPDRFKKRLTIALGVFIPLASLAMSKVAGTLASTGYYGLAVFGLMIGVAVLAVSLGHLAWAIGDVTGSTKKQSWALATALDCGIVLCEFCNVFAADTGLEWVCWSFLAATIGFSMVLNCYAFLNHREVK